MNTHLRTYLETLILDADLQDGFRPYGADDMIGEICMVTGANAGIGRAMTLGLAKMGATVIMVCRDSARGASGSKRHSRRDR